MRITIDTRIDSAEDIRKAIAFLSSLSNSSYSKIGKQPANIFDSPSPSMDSSAQPSQGSADSFLNMFSSSEGSSPAPETKSSYMEPAEEEEKHYDENVRVIPY